MSEILIIFGFSWLLASAGVGLLIAGRHDPHVSNLDELARSGRLYDYHRALDAYKWRVTVHAHGMLFSLVAIVIGFAMPRMGYPAIVTEWLGVAMMSSAVIWTVAGFWSLKIAMGVADLVFVVAVVMTVVGLAKAF